MPEKQKELRQYFETQFWHIVFPIVFISPIQILRSVLELKRCSFCIVSLCVCVCVCVCVFKPVRVGKQSCLGPEGQDPLPRNY